MAALFKHTSFEYNPPKEISATNVESMFLLIINTPFHHLESCLILKSIDALAIYSYCPSNQLHDFKSVIGISFLLQTFFSIKAKESIANHL